MAKKKNTEPAPQSGRPGRVKFDPNEFLTAKAAPPKVTAARLYYDRDGNEVSSEDEAVAKRVKNSHYIRFCSQGRKANELFDPLTDQDEVLTKSTRSTGRLVWEFRDVSETSFDFYLKYLRGKNPANYNNARRSV